MSSGLIRSLRVATGDQRHYLTRRDTVTGFCFELRISVSPFPLFSLLPDGDEGEGFETRQITDRTAE